jgi:hypothetical protein
MVVDQILSFLEFAHGKGEGGTVGVPLGAKHYTPFQRDLLDRFLLACPNPSRLC